MEEHKKGFKELMIKTAEVFQRDLTTTLLDTYWEVMEYYSAAEIEVAFAMALRKCRSFPMPVDLIGFITGSKDLPYRVRKNDDC